MKWISAFALRIVHLLQEFHLSEYLKISLWCFYEGFTRCNRTAVTLQISKIQTSNCNFREVEYFPLSDYATYKTVSCVFHAVGRVQNQATLKSMKRFICRNSSNKQDYRSKKEKVCRSMNISTVSSAAKSKGL